ncbi:P-loop containing nucleoside triphosphate hydrolase protein [Aspergillus venezuelensis]
MEDVHDLEILGLVNRVVSELHNHLGVNDKTLANFLIAQRLDCDTFECFKDKINGMDADFPLSLAESIDRLVRLMHPAMKAMTTDRQNKLGKQQSINEGGSPRVSSTPVPPDNVPLNDSVDILNQLEGLENKYRQRRTQKETQDRTRNRSCNGYNATRRDVQDRYRQRRPRDDNPVLHKIYAGHVSAVKDFGAFVRLHHVDRQVDGLVHISQLADGRVNHPLDVVKQDQNVKVKVIRIDWTKIGLPMKYVNQETGQDLDSEKNFISGANVQALGRGRSRNSKTEGHNPDFSGRQKKRLTSPERWEIRQLIVAGVANVSEYYDLEEDYNAMLQGEGSMSLEQDVDIEVRGDEPSFLNGQTKLSLELSPIRVVKAPDGSLNRAAISGTSLGREREDLRQQEAEAAADSLSGTDLSAQWNDPVVDPEQRRFASDLKSAKVGSANADAIPEWKLATQPKSQSYGKKVNKTMTTKQQRQSLPIFNFRDALIDAIRQHQILVVVGETGSGKTTQTTQYLAEAGFTNDVAAMPVAKRVAEEVGCVLGQEVGYSMQFEECTSSAIRIKYMTDDMLEREVLQDPYLKRYSVIMLDEAHERTIATDILFALLKKTLEARRDLKLIVTSATLDADNFSAYFGGAPIFGIPGRTFPVEILYSREPEPDYLDAALVTVMQIHLTEPAGDILLFLTGQEEIDTSCEILCERMKALGSGSSVPELIILPVYSALPTEMQSRIFEPAPFGSRKVIIAINIAETSITVDDVYYVIDPGFFKQNTYDPKLGMDSLIVTPISQAQAKQRAGRAGRTGPGKCYRLYTEAAYHSEMLPTPIPDIQRQNLAISILLLKAMGVNDLLRFDFMDPPPVNMTLTALEELYALGALDEEGLLTRLGRKMTTFPMEPSLAKVLLVAADLGCSDELLSIVAMLNLTNVFYRPKEKQALADQKKAKFHDAHGDHLTLLNIYHALKRSGYSNAWCFENFIQARSMKRIKDVRDQLVKIMEQGHHLIVSCGQKTENWGLQDSHREHPCPIHPSSALCGKIAEWVIYHELVLTTREYMRWTTSVDPNWLVEAAPTFFSTAGTDGTLSKRRKQERIEPLHDKRLAHENDWRLSAQRRGGRGGGGGTWG